MTRLPPVALTPTPVCTGTCSTSIPQSVRWKKNPATLVDARGFSAAVEGLTYVGSDNYEGPCPPAGKEHTYTFMLYALSADQPAMTRLDAITRSEFEEAYTDKILGGAGITGRFSN